jgi:hypothetical protein
MAPTGGDRGDDDWVLRLLCDEVDFRPEAVEFCLMAKIRLQLQNLKKM